MLQQSSGTSDNARQHSVTAVRRAAGEFTGTASLLAAIVGSGIMAERLAGGNAAITLLANSIATGGALFALILTFGPVSGAHFNPLVTLTAALQREIPWRAVPTFIAAQVTGAFTGVALANLMFGLPPFFASTHIRGGWPLFSSEFLATFGLVLMISSCNRHHSASVPYAVAAYITAAYWIFPSTSFANPAVTMARAATDTFSGIRPDAVPAFIVAQTFGAGSAAAFDRWIFRV